MNNLKVLEYELLFDQETLRSITIQCRRSYSGERWSINDGQMSLGKTPDRNGYFVFSIEPLPSSRNDKYYLEYRFNTVASAYMFWLKNRPKILATPADRRNYYNQCHT